MISRKKMVVNGEYCSKTNFENIKEKPQNNMENKAAI